MFEVLFGLKSWFSREDIFILAHWTPPYFALVGQDFRSLYKFFFQSSKVFVICLWSSRVTLYITFSVSVIEFSVICLSNMVTFEITLSSIVLEIVKNVSSSFL